jgi:hypothetical protein
MTYPQQTFLAFPEGKRVETFNKLKLKLAKLFKGIVGTNISMFSYINLPIIK